jgi:hypothetical protein
MCAWMLVHESHLIEQLPLLLHQQRKVQEHLVQLRDTGLQCQHVLLIR